VRCAGWLVSCAVAVGCTGHERDDKAERPTGKVAPEMVSEIDRPAPPSRVPGAYDVEIPPPKEDEPSSEVQQVVKNMIRRRITELQRCFETRLREVPGLGGKMTFEVEVATGGAVRTVAIKDDTVADAEVAKCAREKILAWQFHGEFASEPWPLKFSVVFSGAR
jgi:hypothetical protein